MNHIIMKLSLILCVIGSIFVSTGDPLSANLIWVIVNPIFAYNNYQLKEKEQTILFSVFTIINIYGIINLWK